jgi:hypothetical protein
MTDRLLRSPLLLSAPESVLLIVDAQDKLLPLIPRHERLVWNLKRLAAAARVLQAQPVPRYNRSGPTLRCNPRSRGR